MPVEQEAHTLSPMVASGIHLKSLAWLALGVVLVTGCVPAEVAPTVLPPSITYGLETATPPLPTPRFSAPASCPVPAGNPEPANLSDPAATADAVLGFLNAGGTIVDLMDQIEAAGRSSGQGDSIRTIDLNSDSWLDVVIALADPPMSGAERRGGSALLLPLWQLSEGGSVLVLLCRGDRYVPSTPSSLEEAGAVPMLHADAELTGDSSTDLLMGWRTCGAHTCFERLEVLSATGAQVIRHALDPSADIPYPELTITADGSVAVTATEIGSVGAGPYRPFTRTWVWESANQAFRLDSEESEKPRYRIHVLLDADAAARLGNLQEALDLYHRVALDDSLLDWVDPAIERANLTGYSMFRVVLAYLRLDDEGDAQKAYGILQNQYLSGAAGQAYASMARAFWDTYTETNDQVQGCRAARDFAEAHPDEILTPLYFGYANPVYTPADVCSSEDK